MTRHLIQLARPYQWSKNLICLAGVIFSGNLSEPSAIGRALLTFAVFVFGSSAVYIFNDILDRHRDQKHPRKSQRPVASGAVPVNVAVCYGTVVAAVSLFAAWGLGRAIFNCTILFMAINVAYSVRLKHFAIVDVFCIAVGFVLRLLAGIYVVGVYPTPWITLCTFFLAVFLGFGKRRAELRTLDDQVAEQRPVLEKYTAGALDELLNSAATITIICYALFTVTSGKNPALILSLPFVYYGVACYKRLVSTSSIGEEPERVIFRDYHILFSALLWLASYLAIEYWDPQWFQQAGGT